MARLPRLVLPGLAALRDPAQPQAARRSWPTQPIERSTAAGADQPMPRRPMRCACTPTRLLDQEVQLLCDAADARAGPPDAGHRPPLRECLQPPPRPQRHLWDGRFRCAVVEPGLAMLDVHVPDRRPRRSRDRSAQRTTGRAAHGRPRRGNRGRRPARVLGPGQHALRARTGLPRKTGPRSAGCTGASAAFGGSGRLGHWWPPLCCPDRHGQLPAHGTAPPGPSSSRHGLNLDRGMPDACAHRTVGFLVCPQLMYVRGLGHINKGQTPFKVFLSLMLHCSSLAARLPQPHDRRSASCTAAHPTLAPHRARRPDPATACTPRRASTTPAASASWPTSRAARRTPSSSRV